MTAAYVPDADQLIEERRSAGLDRHDEIIEGTYFMVPPPGGNHGRTAARLAQRLAQLHLRIECGIGFPNDYVIGDVVALRSDIDGDTVYHRPDDVLVHIEIRSDTNAGIYWKTKLDRLDRWGVPVVIYSADGRLLNTFRLDPETAALMPADLSN